MKATQIHPKVAAVGVAGAVAVVAAFVAAQFGVSVPGDVEAAVAVLISFAAGYLKKS